MRFSPADFFVRRWQFTLVAVVLLVALGLNAWRTTPRSEDPQFPIPVVVVRVALPGASPAEIEQLVVKPIEAAIDGLDQVKILRVSALDGAAQIRAEFTWDADPERKYDEVVREVTALRPALPPGVTRLDIYRSRTTLAVFFEGALVSDTLPPRSLEKVARRLRDQIARVPGVQNADVWGAPPSEARVSLDLGRMAQLGIPPQQVVEVLRAAGAEGPLGSVHAGQSRFDVRSGGAFPDLAAIAATPLAAPGGQVVRVGDVARVEWQTAEPDHLTWFNGRRAVILTANPKDGADVAQVTQRLRTTLDDFRRTLPAGVRLESAFFQADNIERRLNHLVRDFGIALALVLLMLAPLGLRAGAIVATAIPLSLLAALALLQALGFTLNQLTIAGFVLALGLLVDDSIVVVENIARRLRGGEDRNTAAVRGVGEIFFAVVGCTACLMLAFLPLVALPEASGAYIRSLPASVLCTVGASFFVALTVIPFLASRLLPRHAPPEGNRILRVVDRGIQGAYRPLLRRALARPRVSLVVLAAICLLSVPILKGIGTSLFPAADLPQFLVKVETPQGSSLAATGAALEHVERVLARDRSVKWFISNLGRGNTPVFYNVAQHLPDPRYAEVFAAFRDADPRRMPADLERLRQALAGYPGARLTVMRFENGPVIEAPIAVRLSGEDLAVLRDLGGRVERLMASVPGARDVDNPVRLQRTDLNLAVDEAKASVLGLSAGAVRGAVRLALSGEAAGRLRDPDGDDYPVRVRLPMEARNELSALQDVQVAGPGGVMTPLSAVTSPVLETNPARIDRYNRMRAITLTARVAPGYLTSAVTRDVQAKIAAELALPPGYTLALGGEAEASSSSFAGFGAALAIALLGIVAVLVLEFGAFRPALVVAAVIPLGLFGAVCGLWIAGYTLSFTAMIGLIALIGIEIKNSILLVDFTEQIRREGVDLKTAVERAGEIRFLPVLLTSLTAIGGLLPLALGGSGLYAPMAVALIGGLVSSTVLSRIATPVLYLLLASEEAPRREPRAAVSLRGLWAFALRR